MIMRVYDRILYVIKNKETGKFIGSSWHHTDEVEINRARIFNRKSDASCAISQSSLKKIKDKLEVVELTCNLPYDNDIKWSYVMDAEYRGLN